jgi:hypothetical protein
VAELNWSLCNLDSDGHTEPRNCSLGCNYQYLKLKRHLVVGVVAAVVVVEAAEVVVVAGVVEAVVGEEQRQEFLEQQG